MTLLGLGVIGTSAKENEHRLPLHPDHIERLDPDIRAAMTLEDGYAERFGRSDADLAPLVAGFASRKEILASSDVVLLPKPQHSDVAALAPGQVLWGWPHCVQDTALTQLAIDQGLTLIAFEAMNHWTRDGAVGLHVFHKNNELAGFCSVLQAMELAGGQRHLRSPTQRGRDRLRRDGARCRHRPQRARRARHRRAHEPRSGGGRLTDPLGPDPPVRARPGGAAPQSRDHRPRAGAAGAVPRRERHHRQLHAPGHRRPR